MAYADYRNDLHSCGRPLSESLHVEGQQDPRYVMGETRCVACDQLDSYIRRHHKDGLPASAVVSVYSRTEASAIQAAQSERGR